MLETLQFCPQDFLGPFCVQPLLGGGGGGWERLETRPWLQAGLPSMSRLQTHH